MQILFLINIKNSGYDVKTERTEVLGRDRNSFGFHSKDFKFLQFHLGS